MPVSSRDVIADERTLENPDNLENEKNNWKTKKTTGKRKKQLENEKNNWKTKKTTG
jgi:hypothetical protein